MSMTDFPINTFFAVPTNSIYRTPSGVIFDYQPIIHQGADGIHTIPYHSSYRSKYPIMYQEYSQYGYPIIRQDHPGRFIIRQGADGIHTIPYPLSYQYGSSIHRMGGTNFVQYIPGRPIGTVGFVPS
jgi:hypothetical protein